MKTPEVNVRVGPYVVDFFWREEHVIVELDSYAQLRGRSSFEADRKRDIVLKKKFGYEVLRITHRRLRDEPAVVAQDVAFFLSGGAGAS